MGIRARDTEFEFEHFARVPIGAGVAAPAAPTGAQSAGAGLTAGNYLYQVSFVTDSGETLIGTESAAIAVAGGNLQVTLAIPIGPIGTTARKIYRTQSGGATTTERFVATVNDNTTTSYIDAATDASIVGNTLSSTLTALVGAPPHRVWTCPFDAIVTGVSVIPEGNPTWQPAGVNQQFITARKNGTGGTVIGSLLTVPAAATATAAAGAGLAVGAYRYRVTFVTARGESPGGAAGLVTTTGGNQQVNLTVIPTGPAGTLARRIYRTPMSGAAGTERLVATIADNTTTTYSDNLADAALGAPVPGSQGVEIPLDMTETTFASPQAVAAPASTVLSAQKDFVTVEVAQQGTSVIPALSVIIRYRARKSASNVR